jgi:hypothetical protein
MLSVPTYDEEKDDDDDEEDEKPHRNVGAKLARVLSFITYVCW